MLLVDSHLDISWNALGWNRDQTWTIDEIRASEAGYDEQGRGTNTVSLPELRKAEVGLCLATVLARANPAARTNIDFRSQSIAYAMARGQAAYYRAMQAAGQMRQVRTQSELKAHLAAWNSGDRTIGYILAMEGADPILTPAGAREWFELGLRAVGIAHYGPSAYAHGTGCEGGLLPAGRELLAEMRALGMILDATHIAAESFWQALETFDGPVHASHNNCRSLVPGDRQFTDEQIRALTARGAVIGVAFDSWMLQPDWRLEDNRATIADAVNHIDHICQLAGNARHAAIGSDLDGGYGTEQTPVDLNTIADLQKIPALLAARGYSDNDIAGVMHGNWIRFFSESLPA
ncbi:MAG: membrane dipeptidase [Bryobacterales bacterium]|nr:membrane dipeptidase [Bryobacterales bacterium]